MKVALLLLMSNLDDLFNKHKDAFRFEDLPHSRKKLSRHFGTTGMANSRERSAARRAAGQGNN